MTPIELIISIAAAILIVLSGIITFTGTLGLVRLRHFYSRMHAPTLGNTLGVFCMLLAMILVFGFVHKKLLIHPLIITALLVITSPVTAILLMRAGIKRERHEPLTIYAPDEPGTMDLPTKDTRLVEESENEVKQPPKHSTRQDTSG
ncbi:MAG TPA: monovalent cation/H(+) antiporter subunit G [Paenalcaligenes sp.]|nr:monovalent cation/H(+) antiporter subunit G [Paenalcaligenes sp.]